MVEREQAVEITISDGTKATVILGRIGRKEARALKRLVLPESINPENPTANVSREGWLDYQEQTVLHSIKSPANLKKLEVIQSLDDVEVNRLFEVAQEVNLYTPKAMETMEKK